MKTKYSLTILSFLIIFISNAQFGRLQDLVPSINGDMFFFDIDLDGDIDLIVVGDRSVGWYENLGNGEFGSKKTLISNYEFYNSNSGNSTGPFLDVDLDGDLDFYSVSSTLVDQVIYVHENLGGTNFASPVVFNPNFPYEMDRPKLVDLDLDGDFDMIGGQNSFDNIAVSMNVGGSFSPPQVLATYYDIYLGCRLIDFDFNGYQDITYVKQDSLFVIYNNAGSLTPPIFVLELFGGDSNIILADMDADGDIDISSKASGLRFYKNLGANNFVDTTYSVGFNSTLSAIDLDNDGDLDYCFKTWSNNIITLENIGNAIFSNAQSILISSNSYEVYGAMYYADLTDDDLPEILYLWDLDIASSPNDRSRAFLHNNGNLNFDLPVYIDTSYYYKPRDITVGDFNGDYKTDILIATSTEVHLKHQSVQGGFNNELFLNSHYDYNDAEMVSVDYDNDSDLDILVSNFGNGANMFFVENTNGEYVATDTLENLNAFSFGKSMVIDLNSDGFKDVVSILSNEMGYYLNLGNNTFGPRIVLGTAGTLNTFDVGDMNNDGLVDIVYSNYSSSNNHQITWCQNLGNGMFSSPIAINGGHKIQDLHCVDLNLDGYLDILYVTTGSETGGYMFHHLNNGSSNFFSSATINIYDNPDKIVINDFNNDGFFDFAYANNIVKIALNSTSLTFNIIEIENTHLSYFRADIELADIDNDGDFDIILANDENHRVGAVKNYFGSNFQLNGTIFYDLNQNQILDSAELVLPIVDLQFTPSNTVNYTVNSGDFSINLDSGVQVVSYIEDTLWNLTTDSLSYTYFLNDNAPSYDSLLFGFYPDTLIHDLTGDLASGRARCNDSINYWVNVYNTGTLPSNVIVKVILDDDITFVSSDSIPDSSNIDWVSWSQDSLQILSNISIPFSAKIPDGSFSGDTLISQLEIYSLNNLGDSTLLFTDTLLQVVLCSYDPNYKTVNPVGDSIQGFIDPLNLDKFEYQIDFQNIGNDTAYNVVIVDQLSENLNWETFEYVSSSYPVNIQINANGELRFEFININLTDTITNEPESHGYVKYKIGLLPDVLLGDQVVNYAEIFFDLNPPIITNSAVNTISGCNLNIGLDTINTYCAGHDLNLISHNGNFYDVAWSVNGNIVDQDAFFNWPLTTPGIYVIDVEISGDYCNFSESYQIEANQEFTDTSITEFLCIGDTIYHLDHIIYSETELIDTVFDVNNCDAIVYTFNSYQEYTDTTITEFLCVGDTTYHLDHIIYSEVELIDTVYESSNCLPYIYAFNSYMLEIDTSIHVIGPTIFSNQINVSYQWYDCSNESIITGETGSSFTPLHDGVFAVIIENGQCIDTTDCEQFLFYNLPTNNLNLVSVLSNYNLKTVQISSEQDISLIKLIDLNGKIVYIENTDGGKEYIVDIANISSGIYIIECETKNSIIRQKVLIK